MRRKFLIGALLSALMLIGMISPAFAAGETVTTSMKGNDVTITVTDGNDTFTEVVPFAKNTTQTYKFCGYKVQVVYNGSGVKSATIVADSAVKPPTPISNAPAPKLGVDLDGDDMTWNANDAAVAKGAFTQTTSKDKALPSTAVQPVSSAKLDASGDKIPSNAHSGDFPGIYFYWNDKQKDDGILKVDPALFDLFESDESGSSQFYITAKNSNAYWDFWIVEDEGIESGDGYLLYQIPRNFMYTQANNKNGKVEEVKEELKNINMIFIGGAYKEAYLTIDKNWYDEEGNLIVDEALIAELNAKLVFSDGLLLGKNTIKIDNFHDAYFGKKLNVNEGSIAGYKAWENPITVTVNWNQPGSIQFDNQKQYAHIKIDKSWDLLAGSKAPEALFNIYDEDDNLVHEEVGLGTYPVKEGTYKVVEITISGFTANQAEVTITVDAGKTGTVSFKNVEDRASFTINKVWDGLEESGLTAAELNARLTFGGYTLGETNTVKAGSEIQFSEGITEAQWMSTDGKTRYTIEFVSVSIDGDDSDVNDVDLIANEGDDITITFTNKITVEDISACLNVRKVWLSKGDKTEAQLNAMINFNPVLGKQTNLAPGQTIENIGESYIDGNSWLSADGKIRYTIVPVSVAVNGNHKVTSLTLEESSTNSIVFTNKVIWEDVSARLEVLKFWQGDLDGYTCKDLNDMITFKPGLGKSFNLKPGDEIKGIEEVLPSSWVSEDGLKRYSVETIFISVDGNKETTSLTLAEKGRHTIVFVNKLVVEDISATLNVTKKWEGDLGGYTEAQLNAKIKFNPVLGSQTGLVPGTVIKHIGEKLPGSWISADGLTRYTIVPISTLVDGKYSNTLTIAEKGNHSIVFKNKLIVTDISATLNVTKIWDSDLACYSEEDLNAMITFNPELGLQTDLEPGTKIKDIGETLPPSWTSKDGRTRYTIERISTLVDDAETDTLTIAEKGNHTIVFTNKLIVEDISGTLKVSKEWEGDLTEYGFTEEFLNDMITFYPTLGEHANLKPGKVFSDIDEVLPDPWFDANLNANISIEQVSVTVNNVETKTLTVAEGKEYTIIFTNKLVVTPVEEEPIYVIEKKWIDASGAPINDEDLAAYMVMQRGTLYDFSDGDNSLIPGEPNYPGKGDVTITESILSNNLLYKSNPSIEYIISFDNVVVTDRGDDVNYSTEGSSVTFAAKGDGEYIVTFTNKLIRVDYPLEAVGKIYKGPENYYDTPKNPLTGDSVNDGLYFNNPNSPNGKSLDTIYVSVKYYDDLGNELWTPWFWYPYMDPPTGSGKYFTFYVETADGQNYFELRLSLYNRSPSRDINNNHGKWYQDISIEMLEIVGEMRDGPAPKMVPPGPDYDPLDPPILPAAGTIAAPEFEKAMIPLTLTDEFDDQSTFDLEAIYETEDVIVDDVIVDSTEIVELLDLEETIDQDEPPDEPLEE